MKKYIVVAVAFFAACPMVVEARADLDSACKEWPVLSHIVDGQDWAGNLGLVSPADFHHWVGTVPSAQRSHIKFDFISSHIDQTDRKKLICTFKASAPHADPFLFDLYYPSTHDLTTISLHT